ncbi:MAG: serine/threonine protein kinase [Candidatus Enteromonas sp.]
MIKIGDKVDERYRILSRVATGGMADIYEANDLIMKRVVCLKIMKESLLRDPRNVERFANETAVAASFNHPNIVRVYGRGFIEGRPYMATEFVKGQTLRDKLNFSVNMSLSDACEVMLQLTSAIGYIHGHGLVHRDLKPDNLFYLSDGTVKVTDFGISIPIGTMPPGEAIQGTIYYCAPEVLMGNPAEIANDIYSMGVVFYELVTGQVPFEGQNPEEVASHIVKNRFPEATKIMPSLPQSVNKVIATACRKHPSERYINADEFHAAIESLISNRDNFKERRGFLSRLFGFK